MIIARKQLTKIFHKGKCHDSHGADKSSEEKELQQQDASMGELNHAPILTQLRLGARADQPTDVTLGPHGSLSTC